MNILDKVKIGWKEYSIIEREVDDKLISGDLPCFGEIYANEREIYLNKSYDEEQKRATLLHEILHGIDELYQLELNEAQITVLANGLYSVIKDNPDMFK